MGFNSVYFGSTFNTREVANVVSGKQYASAEFLSNISGIPEEVLISENNRDAFISGSEYCAIEISQKYPEFNILRGISKAIKKVIRPDISGKINLQAVKGLIDFRENNIDSICSRVGEQIDIEKFDIPFLNRK